MKLNFFSIAENGYPILVSRFIFNLQEVYHLQGCPPLSSSFAVRQSSIHFTRVIGPLGSSLPSAQIEDSSLWEDMSGAALNDLCDDDAREETNLMTMVAHI